MKDPENTIRVRSCQLLQEHPWSTATQVARGLRMGALRVTTAAVASCLLKLTDEGILTRKSGCGPRGGMGYKLAKAKKPRTWHQRILTEN